MTVTTTGQYLVALDSEELRDLVDTLTLRVLDLTARAERIPDPGRRRQWRESAARLEALAAHLLDDVAQRAG